MNTKHMALAAALAASLTLAACGRNDADTAPPVAQDATEVPASAMATTKTLVDWAGAQPASESLVPLGMAKTVPPVSDSDEPAAIR